VTAAVPVNGLDPIEIVCGAVLGKDDSIPAPPRLGITPRAALERLLVPALNRPPCGVSFSGGRDSSAVLAAAAEVASLHGLPAPIPVSLRFPGIEDTDETSYQEMVVAHLGLRDWVILEPGNSLDIVGELATNLTRRHGLLYPANLHFHVPILEAVSGGTLLTGLGGDEIMGAHPSHLLAATLVGKRKPGRTALREFAERYILRERPRKEIRRAHEPLFPWLVPAAKQELLDRIVEWLTSDYLSASRNLTESTYRMRYLHRAMADMQRVAGDYSVVVGHPFLDPGFVGTIAQRVGWTGPASRTELLESVFGDLLPPELVRRTSKAQFDDIFWTSVAAETVQTLPVDILSETVDGPALLEFWRSDALKGATFLIAQYLRAASDDG
jgi:asparagine synthase (glutamine-hydrolysing)